MAAPEFWALRGSVSRARCVTERDALLQLQSCQEFFDAESMMRGDRFEDTVVSNEVEPDHLGHHPRFPVAKMAAHGIANHIAQPLNGLSLGGNGMTECDSGCHSRCVAWRCQVAVAMRFPVHTRPFFMSPGTWVSTGGRGPDTWANVHEIGRLVLTSVLNLGFFGNPKQRNSLTYNRICGQRESNPQLRLGKPTLYHLTMPAALGVSMGHGG